MANMTIYLRESLKAIPSLNEVAFEELKDFLEGEAAQGVDDDILQTFGTDADIVMLNRSTTLAANTALTNVFLGTPVIQAVPANSLLVSNVTANGDIVLATNLGGNSLEAIRIDASASQIFLGHGVLDTVIANGSGLIVGHTAQLTVAGVVPELQVLGTTTGVDGSMALVTASTTNGDQSQIILGKVGNAALGSFTTVAQGEALGAITWVGDDGTDLATVAARIAAVVNASGTVAASRVPSDLVFSVDPGGADDAIVEAMRLASGGHLILSQGGNDTNILSLRSSDVASGLTTGTGLLDVTASDYFTVGKFAGATGGALVQIVGENAAVTTNGRVESYGGQASTTHSTSGRSLLEFYTTQHDGANALSDITADGNCFGFIARVGGADRTIGILDEDGEFHLDAAVPAAFDAHDDVGLIRALSTTLSPGQVIRNTWDNFVGENEQKLVDLGILGAPRSEGGLLNTTKLQMLHNGAIWQLFSDLMDVVSALPEEIRAKLPDRIKSKLLPA